MVLVIHNDREFSSTLHEVNDGRHHKVPAYCHYLSPVEKGFANVWGHVRQNWNHAERNPVATLNEAVQFYSISGPGSSKATRHFNIYDNNYNSWSNENL